MPRFEIEWGISGSVDNQRVRDVTMDDVADIAEAEAIAKGMAEDLRESNMPTIWWRAKPYPEKMETICTGTAAHPTS